ncbi:MAG: [Clostridia bacterium]|nr:[citrate (pro-3S)-lyase] ligase [Clostridia bacterium]
MRMETGRPFRGAALERLKAFLKSCGLDYDPAVSFSCALIEDGEIIASGSLDGQTLKCIAVSPLRQGEDLAARILTELRREAFERGVDHLMLFTKPGNQMMFSSFGFYPVMRTSTCLLMESRKNGLDAFLASMEKPSGTVGAIVANCNPFTLGHRYLIESAASQVDALHLFILSEDRSLFPAGARMELAKQGCADLKNVFIHPTGPYMVSSATFPSYFIKDKAKVGEIYCELDARLFGEKIAPALGIAKRFVGSEPIDPVTRFYNETLKAHLPEYGIELIEIPRLCSENEAVSASRVRALMEAGNMEELRKLVPESTLNYILRR